MDDIAIRVDHVSKKFCKSLRRSMLYGMTDIGRNMLGLSSNPGRLRRNEFWAVDDVSFEVRKGETLGIIGANGSGKTTILSMLNGIFMPDKGQINVNGRTAALIALGAGFHPMLSGRENIYLAGAIRGLTKGEINERFDDIVDFADIGDFLDSPVKFYSSGMMVRLGFAVAIHIKPEIVLIDEVLSVGDLEFQNKSLRRLAELRAKANGVVFVSHNLDHVRNICDRVLIFGSGKVVFSGNADEASLRYHEMSREKQLAEVKRSEGSQIFGQFSSGDIVFSDSGILDKSGNRTDRIQVGDDIVAFLEFDLQTDVEELYFRMTIQNDKGIACISQSSLDCGSRFSSMSKGKYRLTIVYKSANLVPGVYTPMFGIRSATTGELYEKGVTSAAFRVEGNIIPRAIMHVDSEWRVESIQDSAEVS